MALMAGYTNVTIYNKNIANSFNWQQGDGSLMVWGALFHQKNRYLMDDWALGITEISSKTIYFQFETS